MRIFLVGKRNSINHWLEDVDIGLRAAGHETRVAACRNPAYSALIDNMLNAPSCGALRGRYIARAIRAFRPDLILAVGGFSVPASLLQHMRTGRHRVPLVAWVGDSFDATCRPSADQFDLVAYTDTGFLQLHERFQLAPDAIYLPHAVNPFVQAETVETRVPTLALVAVPTPFRRSLVATLRHPVALYGPGWDSDSDVSHQIVARRVSAQELLGIYARHMGVLNIRSELHVINGLNQRNFTPYLTETAVVTNADPDLELCFTPGEDVLVYRNEDELNDVCARLRREPDLAARIARQGRRRVLNDHTFSQRLHQIRDHIASA